MVNLTNLNSSQPKSIQDIKNQGIKGAQGRNFKLAENDDKMALFLSKYGLDKEAFLKIADENSKTFASNMYLRSKALEIYTKEQEALADFLNATTTRGITMYNDLVELTADIAQRKQRMMANDPLYDPLEDKHLQKAMERKQLMLAQFDRMKIDVKKLAMDYKEKREGGTIDADAATVTDLDLSEFDTQ
jgi:hypothetical protein